MKGSLRGGRVFSEEGSVQGRRFNKLKKSAYDDDDDDHDNDIEIDLSLGGEKKLSSSSKTHHPPHFDDETDIPLMDAEPDSSFYEPSSTSPFTKSPWSSHINPNPPPSPSSDESNLSSNFLMGSLVREEGHIYSLAAFGDLLYTGSDSKNIRVWKNQKEYSGFKSNSGLVKAIVIGGDRIFTGHQDGKVRVWRISGRDPSVYKRIGTLPTFGDFIKCSMKPSNYVEVRKRRNVLWIKHFDAISALSLSEDKAYLYSASWDKTFKVWRVSDSKCLESIKAHDDAVNTLVSSIDGLVFTGSADGSVKVWRREVQGKGTKHFFSQTLLKQECAITALAVNEEATYVYCGSSDGVVNFWEREKSLSHGGTFQAHKLAILCLGTAGNLMLSGSADTGICVWQRMGKKEHVCLSVLTGHTGPVKCLAIERDNEASYGEKKWIVYSGSLDKSVKMWRVSEQMKVLKQNSKKLLTETSPPTPTTTNNNMLVNAPSFVIRDN